MCVKLSAPPPVKFPTNWIKCSAVTLGVVARAPVVQVIKTSPVSPAAPAAVKSNTAITWLLNKPGVVVSTKLTPVTIVLVATLAPATVTPSVPLLKSEAEIAKLPLGDIVICVLLGKFVIWLAVGEVLQNCPGPAGRTLQLKENCVPGKVPVVKIASSDKTSIPCTDNEDKSKLAEALLFI